MYIHKNIKMYIYIFISPYRSQQQIGHT